MDSILSLAEVRKAKGFTQESLAKRSGVHRVSIARYETGKASPNLRTLERLSDALGVPITALTKKKVG